MLDGTRSPSGEAVTPPTPVDLLWEYAYSLADRRAEQEAWLDERQTFLESQSPARLNMYDRQALADKQLEYNSGYAVLVGTKADEAAALILLERVEADSVEDEEILSFIPQEFIDEQQARLEEETPKTVETGGALSRSYS